MTGNILFKMLKSAKYLPEINGKNVMNCSCEVEEKYFNVFKIFFLKARVLSVCHFDNPSFRISIT